MFLCARNSIFSDIIKIWKLCSAHIVCRLHRSDMESFFPYLMGTFFNHLLFSSVSSGSIPHLDLLWYPVPVLPLSPAHPVPEQVFRSFQSMPDLLLFPVFLPEMLFFFSCILCAFSTVHESFLTTSLQFRQIFFLLFSCSLQKSFIPCTHSGHNFPVY